VSADENDNAHGVSNVDVADARWANDSSEVEDARFLDDVVAALAADTRASYDFLISWSDATGVLGGAFHPYVDFDDESDWVVPLPSTPIVYADCAFSPSDGIAVCLPAPTDASNRSARSRRPDPTAGRSTPRSPTAASWRCGGAPRRAEGASPRTSSTARRGC
jgi:hypothetical protein